MKALAYILVGLAAGLALSVAVAYSYPEALIHRLTADSSPSPPTCLVRGLKDPIATAGRAAKQ